MKIVIQGAEASFHHIAANHYYGLTDDQTNDFVYADTFAAVFATLAANAADTAVVAIENSLYGSITSVYDLLQKYRFPIVGEVVEHIHQNLITFPDTKPADVRRIYSHPVALAQCAHYLAENFPEAEIIEHHDTAAAVEYIKMSGDHSSAAIAGSVAAKVHGMFILKAGIQDEPLNFTRFLVIDPHGSQRTDADKASIIITTSHEPGALHRALGVFADVGSNLTKLQSRPISGKVWKYQFYIDLEITPAALQIAIELLALQECDVINLGSYKAAATVYED
jgi:prephenate dehydratase